MMAARVAVTLSMNVRISAAPTALATPFRSPLKVPAGSRAAAWHRLHQLEPMLPSLLTSRAPTPAMRAPTQFALLRKLLRKLLRLPRRGAPGRHRVSQALIHRQVLSQELNVRHFLVRQLVIGTVPLMPVLYARPVTLARLTTIASSLEPGTRISNVFMTAPLSDGCVDVGGPQHTLMPSLTAQNVRVSQRLPQRFPHLLQHSPRSAYVEQTGATQHLPRAL
jgi:hypothetical protein